MADVDVIALEATEEPATVPTVEETSEENDVLDAVRAVLLEHGYESVRMSIYPSSKGGYNKFSLEAERKEQA